MTKVFINPRREGKTFTAALLKAVEQFGAKIDHDRLVILVPKEHANIPQVEMLRGLKTVDVIIGGDMPKNIGSATEEAARALAQSFRDTGTEAAELAKALNSLNSNLEQPDEKAVSWYESGRKGKGERKRQSREQRRQWRK